MDLAACADFGAVDDSDEYFRSPCNCGELSNDGLEVMDSEIRVMFALLS